MFNLLFGAVLASSIRCHEMGAIRLLAFGTSIPWIATVAHEFHNHLLIIAFYNAAVHFSTHRPQFRSLDFVDHTRQVTFDSCCQLTDSGLKVGTSHFIQMMLTGYDRDPLPIGATMFGRIGVFLWVDNYAYACRQGYYHDGDGMVKCEVDLFCVAVSVLSHPRYGGLAQSGGRLTSNSILLLSTCPSKVLS